jgi:two-component system response regulator YesN
MFKNAVVLQFDDPLTSEKQEDLLQILRGFGRPIIHGDVYKADDFRPRPKHASVEKALRFIEKHYDRDLTLREVAEHVQMNATYLSVLFKEETGLTYIKYLTKLRMNRAKAMLQEGMPVNEVSKKVGYFQYRHFSEVFKKHFGMTPGEVRKNRWTLPQKQDVKQKKRT